MLLALTLLLGGMGAHKFYVGKNLQGALYMLFSWTLVPAAIAVVEFAAYSFTSAPRLEAKYPAARSIPFVALLSAGYFAGLGLLAAIAIGAHEDYEIRAATAEGVLVADSLRTAIANAYRNDGPADMTCGPDHCRVAAARVGHSPSVRRVTSDRTGTITIEYEEQVVPAPRNRLAISPLMDGKAVDLSDPRSTGANLTWTCGQSPATTLASKHLPSACR